MFSKLRAFFTPRVVEVLAIAFLFLVSSFLVFWKLGYGSMKPWDEGWYAAISHNLTSQPNKLVLQYNNAKFYDHPPLGFYFKALSMAIGGESTFTIRFPEAVAGIVSILAIYFVGRRLSSGWAGFWSALILLSCRWFLFRARSGNLDILLVSTQLLVLLGMSILITTSFKKVGAKEKTVAPFTFATHGWLFATWFFWGLSLMSKTLISLQIGPAIAIATLYYWWQTGYKVFSWKTIALAVGAVFFAILPLAPWVYHQYNFEYDQFIAKQMRIGLRTGTTKELTAPIVNKTLSYLHAAVHLWYKIMLAAVACGVGLVVISRKRLYILFLLFYVFLISFPYFISPEAEIWHLIPMVAALAALAGIVIDHCINEAVQIFSLLMGYFKIKKNIDPRQLGLIAKVGMTVLVLLIATVSWKHYFAEFLSPPATADDYETVMKHVSNKNIVVYTATEAYFPSMVYYANLNNAPLRTLHEHDFKETCQQHTSDKVSLQLISRFGDWTMQKAGDYIKYRDGDLQYVELSPEECDKVEKTLIE